MATLSEICDEKVSSPSTMNTGYFEKSEKSEKSEDYDCEVAVGDKPDKRSFGRRTLIVAVALTT
jgi:hypothetical protein